MATRESNPHSASYDTTRLFIASCAALATGAMVFIVRADVQDQLRAKFSVNQETIGGVMGLWALGIAVTILLSSLVYDTIGAGNLLRLASLFHCTSIVLTILAPSLLLLQVAVFLSGIAHGFIEGSINPLIATIYPTEKTHKLNVLHAWWPGGLVIGGLMAQALGKLNVDWQVKLGVILVPAIAYGVLMLGQKVPQTERVTSGISYRDMLGEALRPGFILIAICMLFTAATELGPNQWMESVLKTTANISGTLVFVYGSLLMFGMRFFAGPLAHKISPVGMLLMSSVLASIGLFVLSYAHDWPLAYFAGTIFYVGVCYYWPTMLAYVSEQFPRGGAFTISLLGFMGMISILKVIPLMGRIRDTYSQQYGDEVGAAMSFRIVSAVPLILVFIFGAMYAWYRAKGGYRPVPISGETIIIDEPQQQSVAPAA